MMTDYEKHVTGTTNMKVSTFKIPMLVQVFTVRQIFRIRSMVSEKTQRYYTSDNTSNKHVHAIITPPTPLLISENGVWKGMDFSYFSFKTWIVGTCENRLKIVHIQGVPKKRSRYKKVYRFLNKTDISKTFYTVGELL